MTTVVGVIYRLHAALERGGPELKGILKFGKDVLVVAPDWPYLGPN